MEEFAYKAKVVFACVCIHLVAKKHNNVVDRWFTYQHKT